MSSHRAQNGHRLLLHFQQLLKLLKSLVVPAAAEQVGHLKHHRIQHRLCHCVNVGFLDFLRTGIGADFLDFSVEGGHGTAGNVNEIHAQIGGNPLSLGGKMPGDPGHQIPLILPSELYDAAMLADGLPELFQPLVRFPGNGEVGKYHRAIVRHVAENLRQLVPVAFRQLERIHIVHLHQGVLGHHGQIFHTVGKALHVEGLLVQPVIVEGFRQRIQRQLAHLGQIMIQQEGFLPVKKVQPPQFFLLQLRFQFLQAAVRGLCFCHGGYLLMVMVPF